MTNFTHWFWRARLKTRQLFLLAALSEEGNIHRAAQALNMTQPAASKLLKELEDVLGVSLFDRLPRGISPTWYGETMIRHTKAALASLSLAHDEMLAAMNGQFGQVNVGSITAPGLALLPPTVAAVKREHPKLQIAVHIEPSNVLIEMLNRGKLDILVGRLSVEHDKADLRYELLANEPVSAVGRPGHPLRNANNLTVADIGQYGWILPPSATVLRHKFDLMFQELDLQQPADYVESSSFLFITKMILQSDMVAVMATDVARFYADRGLLVILPVAMPLKMEPFGFITRRDRQLSPACTVFLNALKASAVTVYDREVQIPQ